MFDRKIKVDKRLYDRLARIAKAAGYSSTEEFVIHVLEAAAGDPGDEDSDDLIRKRLQGLGYLE